MPKTSRKSRKARAQEDRGEKQMSTISRMVDTLLLGTISVKKARPKRRGEHIEIPIADRRLGVAPITCPLTTFDDTRLFAIDHELLLKDPSEYHEDRSEVALLRDDNSIAHLVFKRTTKEQLPKYVHRYPSDSILYVMHYRDISPSFPDCFHEARVVAWSPDEGRAFVLGRNAEESDVLRKERKQAKFNLVLTAGIIEDSLPFWQVRVQSWKGLAVYADEPGIKDVCELRDNPTATPTGRRNPILHWVDAHVRRTKKNPEGVEVEKHLRGITAFNLEGYAVDITRPVK